MEEYETPERVQEDMHERVHESRERWMSHVALSSALIAALAAVCALLSSHHESEGMLDRLVASDQWSYYQAKGVEARLLESERFTAEVLGKAPPDEMEKKLREYGEKRVKSANTATEHEKTSRDHIERHVIFARGVTMFQIAIAVGAISVLTRRTRYWMVGLAFAAVGVFFLLQGWLFAHWLEGARVVAPGIAG